MVSRAEQQQRHCIPQSTAAQLHMIRADSWCAGQNSNKDTVGSALGTALGVAAPCIGIIIWLAVTYTYRLEKRALSAAIINRLTAIDIAEKGAPFRMKDPQMLTGHLDRDDSATNFIIPAHREEAASPAMLKVAKDMTHRCLRRWDSILALRASTDSQGKGQGIWRDRYEGVRASVMLLALHNLNRQLQTNVVVPYDGEPGGSTVCTQGLYELMLHRAAHIHISDIQGSTNTAAIQILCIIEPARKCKRYASFKAYYHSLLYFDS